MKPDDRRAKVIDLMSHACVAKLLAAIAEDADETTLKAAVSEFPSIVSEIIQEAVSQLVDAEEPMVQSA